MRNYLLAVGGMLACTACVAAPPPEPVISQVTMNAGADNSDCRDYAVTATLNGTEQQVAGRACRQQDGSWRITEGPPAQPPGTPPSTNRSPTDSTQATTPGIGGLRSVSAWVPSCSLTGTITSITSVTFRTPRYVDSTVASAMTASPAGALASMEGSKADGPAECAAAGASQPSTKPD
jgi:hypothetical protein